MQILSFGLRARRVLVITPATILRDQTADEFHRLTTLGRIEVVPPRMPRPRVHAQEHRLSSAAAWRSLARYDVVVATPHTVSPEFQGVAPPPSGLFDLVLMDEAHHSRAPTWARLLSEFASAKCVLLTATPFRRDKKRLQASLVYFYPIGRALDAGIYRPIRYLPVPRSHPDESDEAICRVVKRLLAAEARRGNRSKLLVRAERVSRAHALVEMYRRMGMPVASVDYQKSLAENTAVIEAVERDEMVGIVCVGMVGEGLDLPELKIAAFHDVPDSFPFTLQFIGRVSRPARGQIGDAYLVAVPDDVRGPIRRLYHQDADWRRLIPELVNEAVGQARELSHVRTTLLGGDVAIDPADLRPFVSIRTYDVGANRVQLASATSMALPDNVQLCSRPELSQDGQLLVLLTETQEAPKWAAGTSLVNVRYDLHVYYYDPGGRLLFEYSTSPTIARWIRRVVAHDPPRPIRPDKLMKVIDAQDVEDYIMVGLRNAAGGGPSQPSYKTLMGKSVQATILPSDGRVFAAGHALARLSSEEVRGVAMGNGRIWAVRRLSVVELRAWCERTAGMIGRRRHSLGLPQMEFLARPQKIDRLESQPLTVLLDERLLGALITVRVSDPGAAEWANGDLSPQMDIRAFDRREGRLECAFTFSATVAPLRVDFRISTGRPWTNRDVRRCLVRVEPGEGELSFEGDLEAFLEHYPPVLVRPEGGIVINDTLWVPDQKPGPLPDPTLVAKSWSGCDRTREFEGATRGRLTVHEWVEREILGTARLGCVLVYDHRPSEIADYVLLDPSTKRISMYHCKSMRRGAAPADRVGELYEVIGQACRSTRWVRAPEFLNVIRKHVDPPRASPVRRGSRLGLERLADAYQPNAWAFRIVVVQPGCSLDMLRRRNGKLYELACAGYEWVVSSQAEFELWGS